MSVESEVNRGTSFEILVPRHKEVVEILPLSDTAGQPVAGKETILLVEDQPDVRWLVRQMLFGCGYTVIEAVDQQAAISICSKQEPEIHLMLTDVVMPRMSGPQLASKVRTLRPQMKILYMSGYAQDKFESYVGKDEPFAFIQKPLTPEALATKVREVLDSVKVKPGDQEDHENSRC